MVQLRLVQPAIPQMQIMRYMGNKRGILDFLVPRLEELVEPGNVFLDLFAGTCSVGYAMKRRCVVYANDIQEYSYTISRALLSDRLGIDSLAQAREELADSYHENL